MESVLPNVKSVLPRLTSPNLARLGEVRLGYVRLGSVRLGYVLLGLVASLLLKRKHHCAHHCTMAHVSPFTFGTVAHRHNILIIAPMQRLVPHLVLYKKYIDLFDILPKFMCSRSMPNCMGTHVYHILFFVIYY